MHQIKNITKIYTTGDLQQKALDNVSFNLRNNEFVSILGHSGSGKTTLLNVIGGLDRYDSGDIIIDGISTQKYSDRDWDSYRNHSVGFVFQSYNLIPHQSVLSNVELALTISGISASQRKEKAIQALINVGLKEHIHKKPNQLSGGQMQRVAIARALVNEPDILLADEPTGALDTETSLQIMDLLKKVAKDRLVVMVTHNAELAHSYSNRIIELQDGKVISDSNPFSVDELVPSKHENMGKASMSFLTALSLSFNNLNSKKARTFLTAFAGSIGIIGIALILSLSTGVNDYIDGVQEETMTAYPIAIEQESVDFNSLITMQSNPTSSNQSEEDENTSQNLEAIYTNSDSLEQMNSIQSSFRENNLTSFKEYLEEPNNAIAPYVGKNGIVYSYDLDFSLYTYDQKDHLINTDGSTFENSTLDELENFGPPSGSMGETDSFGPPNSSMGQSEDKISELTPGGKDQLISPIITDNYELIHGHWPEDFDEILLTVNTNNELNLSDLYELGILPADEYEKILAKIDDGEELNLKQQKIDFEKLTEQTFYLLSASDYFKKDQSGNFEDISTDTLQIDQLVEQKAVKLKVVGIIKPKEEANTLTISTPLSYTKALRDYLIDYNNESEVVKTQIENPQINILNGLRFKTDNDDQKIEDTYEYLSHFSMDEQADFISRMGANSQVPEPSSLPQANTTDDEGKVSEQFEVLVDSLDDQTLLEIYDSSIATSSYEDNLKAFGVIDTNSPSSINIYADNFEDKENISKEIENYNQEVDENERITYSDFTELIMSSVTEIVNVITYVLIAFVSVSLLVSSIMIGIITYISVLERTKEIGILRAIGASKRNISTVFNAETIIIGLLSGLLGIGFTYLLHSPLNNLLTRLLDNQVAVNLSFNNALILILLSIFLSFIAGLIPSKQASRKDPVDALRTE